jgi:hypothetical protein
MSYALSTDFEGFFYLCWINHAYGYSFMYIEKRQFIDAPIYCRIVLIITGISVGFVGAWLDVLVAW